MSHSIFSACLYYVIVAVHECIMSLLLYMNVLCHCCMYVSVTMYVIVVHVCTMSLLPYMNVLCCCCTWLFCVIVVVHVVQTATTGDLKEMETKVKYLIQETRWFINMKKISQDYEIVMKDAIQRVEGVMRRILYPKQHGDDPKVEVCVLSFMVHLFVTIR